jgi:hypothetical protein
MGVTVGVNGMSVVHEGSSGIATAFPDTCNTPGPPVPVPYPNIAQSSDTAKGTKKVKCDGKSVAVSSSNFSTSSGDEAGSAPGGVVSAKTKGKAEFINFSFDVKFEGKNVERAMDMVLQNDKNTPPFPVMQGPSIAMANVQVGERQCCVCEKKL